MCFNSATIIVKKLIEFFPFVFKGLVLISVSSCLLVSYFIVSDSISSRLFPVPSFVFSHWITQEKSRISWRYLDITPHIWVDGRILISTKCSHMLRKSGAKQRNIHTVDYTACDRFSIQSENRVYFSIIQLIAFVGMNKLILALENHYNCCVISKEFRLYDEIVRLASC